MSLLIRGGYDVFRKQILNISLKRTNVWTQGLIMVRKNIFVSSLAPLNENKIELVKYDNRHALLLNNAIIYEDQKLFSYKVDLQVGSEMNERVLIDLDLTTLNFIEYQYLDYEKLKRVDSIWGAGN
jgi:hypothetical protein